MPTHTHTLSLSLSSLFLGDIYWVGKNSNQPDLVKILKSQDTDLRHRLTFQSKIWLTVTSEAMSPLLWSRPIPSWQRRRDWRMKLWTSCLPVSSRRPKTCTFCSSTNLETFRTWNISMKKLNIFLNDCHDCLCLNCDNNRLLKIKHFVPDRISLINCILVSS